MDRLAALFEQLPLPEITRLLRRTVFGAIGVGVVALVLSVVLNHPLAGLGACIGLGLGLLNVRLITASVAHVNATPVERPKRVLASQTLTRLAITTVVVVGLLVASVQVGFGTAAGLAVFYFVLIANLVQAILKQGTTGAGTWSAAPVSVTTTTLTIPVGDHITRHIAGLTLNVDDIFSTVVAGVIVIGLGLLVRAKVTSGVPGKLQLAFETIVGAVDRQIEGSMGEAGKPIVPLAVTLFLFILIANSLEFIPTGHNPQYLPPPTSDVNFPLAMAAVVIILVHATWIRRQGLKSYVGHYFRPFPALFPINVIEEITKPITLTLRLFGNIFSGGLMLVLIADLLPARFIAPIPILDVVWKIFDGLFVGPVQAFIFALLTILYFESAIAGSH